MFFTFKPLQNTTSSWTKIIVLSMSEVEDGRYLTRDRMTRDRMDHFGKILERNAWFK